MSPSPSSDKENNEIDNKSTNFWQRSSNVLNNLIDSYYYRGIVQGTILGSLTTFLVLRYHFTK